MNFLRYSKFYFVFSIVLILFSVVALSVWGLKIGIDFSGGTLFEIKYIKDRPEIVDLRKDIDEIILGEFTLQEVGEQEIILRMKEISDEQRQKIIESLGSKDDYSIEEEKKISPIIGGELKKSTARAIILAFIFITLYVAWAFRRVSQPVSSFKYGMAALIALFHDVLITCGIFAVLGEFFNMEINVPFAAALLTILGYSINDTIVVFDRCRENLIRSRKEFKDILNLSLSQIVVRSLFTSVTTLLVLFSIYFFGGATLSSFVLTLIIGIILGTYSSIFIATPLIFIFSKKR